MRTAHHKHIGGKRKGKEHNKAHDNRLFIVLNIFLFAFFLFLPISITFFMLFNFRYCVTAFLTVKNWKISLIPDITTWYAASIFIFHFLNDKITEIIVIDHLLCKRKHSEAGTIRNKKPVLQLASTARHYHNTERIYRKSDVLNINWQKQIISIVLKVRLMNRNNLIWQFIKWSWSMT